MFVSTVVKQDLSDMQFVFALKKDNNIKMLPKLSTFKKIVILKSQLKHLY